MFFKILKSCKLQICSDWTTDIQVYQSWAVFLIGTLHYKKYMHILMHVKDRRKKI